jgi:L-amino acid N-acyltransferase
MKIVECSLAGHGGQILAIINEVILNSTAVYDYEARPASSMEGWFATKVTRNFPVLGVEDEGGELLGFSTYGEYRAWPAYKYSAELSLYVRSDARGKGVGRSLLGRLVEVAEERELHVLVAGIDSTNAASIALHEKLGFELAGVVRECGFKFGRWLDVAFYQRVLKTPAHPVDGM